MVLISGEAILVGGTVGSEWCPPAAAASPELEFEKQDFLRLAATANLFY